MKSSPSRKSVVTGCDGRVKLIVNVSEGPLNGELVVADEYVPETEYVTSESAFTGCAPRMRASNTPQNPYPVLNTIRAPLRLPRSNIGYPERGASTTTYTRYEHSKVQFSQLSAASNPFVFSNGLAAWYSSGDPASWIVQADSHYSPPFGNRSFPSA